MNRGGGNKVIDCDEYPWRRGVPLAVPLATLLPPVTLMVPLVTAEPLQPLPEPGPHTLRLLPQPGLVGSDFSEFLLRHTGQVLLGGIPDSLRLGIRDRGEIGERWMRRGKGRG